VQHDLDVFDTANAAANAAAAFVLARARAAVAHHGQFTFAVSGGHSPWAMCALLAQEEMPWQEVVVFQVDERIAPDGDPDRNLTHLRAALGVVGQLDIRPMPVTDPDPDAAAGRYAEALPARFDLVHLGLGPDGHTASLVPGDPVLDVHDRLVAVTAEYQGRRRMTLTYPALARVDQLLWLVTGVEKEHALAKLLAFDPEIPAGRVEAARSLIFADRAASPTSGES
jgi:6-phosphogluconolactonase